MTTFLLSILVGFMTICFVMIAMNIRVMSSIYGTTSVTKRFRSALVQIVDEKVEKCDRELYLELLTLFYELNHNRKGPGISFNAFLLEKGVSRPLFYGLVKTVNGSWDEPKRVGDLA